MRGLPAPRETRQPHLTPVTGEGGIKLGMRRRRRCLSCACRLAALLSVSPAKAEDSRRAGPLPTQNTIWPDEWVHAHVRDSTARPGSLNGSIWADAGAPGPTGVSTLQGGFGILEEMCVNYVHYYPQTQLELCKSAVDPGFLQKYFHLVNR